MSAVNIGDKARALIAPILSDIDIDQSYYGKFLNIYKFVEDRGRDDEVALLFKVHSVSLHIINTESDEWIELSARLALHKGMEAPIIVTDREVYRWARRHRLIRYIPKKLKINYDKERDNNADA